MNNSTKRKISIAAIIIASLYLLNLVDLFFRSHSIISDKKEYKDYMYLLHDIYQKDIDKYTPASYVKKNDVLVSVNYVPGISLLDRDGQISFGYRKDSAYHIRIWEFKKLSALSIDSVPFWFNRDLDDLKVTRGEVLAPRSTESVSINFKYRFTNKMQVNTDRHSRIKNEVRGKDYKGFFGELNRVSLSNENDRHKIFIDYEPRREVLFLVVNKQNRFCIITVTCNKAFDESIMELFNLE